MLGKSLQLLQLAPHSPQHFQKWPNDLKSPKFNVFQTKEMQAEVEIGQKRSARQFAADTLNPRCMTTLAFFRVVRKMIVVSENIIFTRKP